jgi:hypothetical protein
VSLKTFFENTLREEAEQMKGALNVVIVVPPPRPIPIILLVLVEEVNMNVIPNRTWSDVGNLNDTMDAMVDQSTKVSPQIYSPPPPRSSLSKLAEWTWSSPP